MRSFALLSTLIWVSTTYAESPKTPTSLEPTVVDLAQAPERQVPSGKARIKILAQGQKAFVGQLWLAAGASVPLHKDASEEYIYVVSGSGQITINGKASTIGPGTMVFMPSHAEVSFKNGDAPLVAIQVFAGTESAKKYEKWAPHTPARKTP